MTRRASRAAIFALNDNELARIESAFGFMKGCAEYYGVPHADQWQLDYLDNGIAPWRVVDRGAQNRPESHDNVAFTFYATTAAGLRIEMQVYGKAFRGLAEIRDKGSSSDFMAASRR